MHSEPIDDIKEIPQKQIISTAPIASLTHKDIELPDEQNTTSPSEDDSDLSSAADLKPESKSKQITSGVDLGPGHDIENNQHGSTLVEHSPLCEQKQDKYSTQLGSTIGPDESIYPKKMNTAKTSVTETFNVESKILVTEVLQQSKWGRRMNISCNKKTSLPILSRDVPPVKVERRHTYHYDLRALPIDLEMLNENHISYKKALNVITAMNAFQSLLKTESEKEADKINKQEEMLKLYTTVYDIKSGNMVNYHDYYQTKKGPSWKYPNSAELQAERLRVQRNRIRGKEKGFTTWIKGLFNFKANSKEQNIPLGSKSRYKLR